MKMEAYTCDKCGEAMEASDAYELHVFAPSVIRLPFINGNQTIHDAHLCRPCAERLRKSLPFLGGRQ